MRHVHGAGHVARRSFTPPNPKREEATAKPPPDRHPQGPTPVGSATTALWSGRVARAAVKAAHSSSRRAAPHGSGPLRLRALAIPRGAQPSRRPLPATAYPGPAPPPGRPLSLRLLLSGAETPRGRGCGRPSRPLPAGPRLGPLRPAAAPRGRAAERRKPRHPRPARLPAGQGLGSPRSPPGEAAPATSPSALPPPPPLCLPTSAPAPLRLHRCPPSRRASPGAQPCPAAPSPSPAPPPPLAQDGGDRGRAGRAGECRRGAGLGERRAPAARRRVLLPPPPPLPGARTCGGERRGAGRGPAAASACLSALLSTCRK